MIRPDFEYLNLALLLRYKGNYLKGADYKCFFDNRRQEIDYCVLEDAGNVNKITFNRP